MRKADWMSSFLPAEHPHNSQSAPTEWEQQQRKQTCSIGTMQPHGLRADQAGYNTPFWGCCSCLHSWHCHHKCPAAFSLDPCISLTNPAETNPRWGASQHCFIHLPVYLSGAGVELAQVGKLRCGCVYQEAVGMCLPTHTCGRGWTQPAESCAFVCLQQATASWSHKNFQSCSTACKSQKALLGSCLLWQSWSLKVGLHHSLISSSS